MKKKSNIRVKPSQLFLLTLILISLTQALFAASDSRNKYGAPWVGVNLTGQPCKGKDQAFGPFDYLSRTEYRTQLRLVEGAHLNQNVIDLSNEFGKNGYLRDELDYTLRAWPNHHIALQSISRYQTLHTSSKDIKYSHKLTSPVECYFQRAINFSPNDSITHMLFAIYLQKLNHKKKASEQYEAAIKISPENISIRYNYGLLLFSMKHYEQSLENAQKAYASGYPLPGLKKMLIKSGHWLEPNTSNHNSLAK